MANPFYTPEMQPGADRLNQVVKNYTQIQDMVNNRDLGQQRNAIQQQGIDVNRQHYANELINQQAQRAMEAQKLKPSQRPYTEADVVPLVARLKAAGMDKHFSPVVESLYGFAKNPGVNRGQAALNFQTDWEQTYKPAMIQALTDAYTKRATEMSAGKGEGNPEDIKQILKSIENVNQMAPEDAAKMIFPDVHHEWQNEKAALQANKPSRKQIVEIPFPDGRTAQRFSVDVDTGEQTPVGQPYKVKSQVTNVNVHGGGGGSATDKYRLENVTFTDGSTGMVKVHTKTGDAFDPNTMENVNNRLGRKGIVKPKNESEIDRRLREKREGKTGGTDKYKVGQTVTKNGKNYKYIGNNLWQPQ